VRDISMAMHWDEGVPDLFFGRILRKDPYPVDYDELSTERKIAEHEILITSATCEVVQKS
jgi:hypothetical protein